MQNNYLWFKVICIKFLLGEVWTRTLITLVVTDDDPDSPPVQIFFLVWMFFAPLRSFPAPSLVLVLLITLCDKEENGDDKEQSPAKDDPTSSWDDHS